MMETGQAGYSMEGSYMNQEINSYGPGPTSQGSDAYMRMNENMHMPHYNSYNRPGYQSMESNDYGNVNSGVGGYQPGAYSGPPRSNMGHMRHGSGGGMVPGPQGYSSGLPLMMSGQSISQQSGPTPTLNTLLQSPNTQPHYSSNYDGFSGPHKGSDMASANGGYGMPPGWMQQSPRGMGNYSQMPMPGSSPYRGQNQNYNQSGYPQYSNQGSTQPSPGQGQDQGSSPQQQRPTPQTSPHQSISPAPSPSPAHKLQHNRSPGPTRPKHPSSPGKPGRSSGRSVSPSSRSSSSQQSPPGHQQSNSQHNHLSSPKITSPGDDVKGEATPMRDSSRPEPSPGSVGSRSNTPSLSGSSPMPPRPPSQHDGSQPQRMSHSPMSSSGYNQQMMPPPMGPNQMGAGYNQGNYPMRQPGPGGQHMYSNMNRGNYNMYPNSMMGMNNQYGNFNGPGPVPNSQGAPPGPNGMHNSGPQMNGPAPHSNMRPVSGGSVGSNGPVGPPTPSGTPIKGAQAAAQVAMATAARTQQPPTPGRQQPSSMAPSSRMYNGPPAGMPVHGPQHGMPPQSMSPLGHMYQMGNIPPHPQNSGSPVPPSSGKMHNNSNSVNNYGGDERPPPKSKKSKSSRGGGGGGHDSVNNNIQNNSIASPHMPMPSPGMSDNNSQGPRPSSTPASTLSDAGSQSNDSMGPLMNNDSGTGQVHSGHHGGHVNMDNNSPASFTNNIHEHTIRTVANAGVETNTMVRRASPAL
ncbi:hypothetical protein DPMN_045770 [Dreissena polymorpha]|uniref:Uncharacterized protein n=1 Tax=Dreissena polymorpha TaxID=45954 RepID=A0A9D4D4Z0_DREPO|nr:hypothetical protein DPMN_045770 [Dreissena polymorpha]